MIYTKPRSSAAYLNIVRRRPLVIAVPIVVLICSAVLSLSKFPEFYESTAVLRLVPNKELTSADFASRLADFRRQLSDRESIANLLEVIGTQGTAQEADARSKISVEPDTTSKAEPASFAVSFLANDPQKARAATDFLASALVTANANRRQSQTSDSDALRKRLADVLDKLRELETEDPSLSGLQSEPPKSNAPSAASQYSHEALRTQQLNIESLKDQQYKIEQQLVDLERRISSQRQIVELQKKGSSLGSNPAYAVLISKRSELQGQRDTLINRQELTDKHPRVLAINDQIAAINRQIEELRQQEATTASQTPEARELAGLESDRNRLKLDLEVIGRDLARRSVNASAPSVRQSTSPARRNPANSKRSEEYLALTRTYDEISGELKRIDGRSEVTSFDIRVLEPARAPERPVSQNRELVIAINALVGLLIGLTAAGLFESRRFNSLVDARDVEYHTRLPLLAAIPRVITSEQRRRARRRSLGLIGLTTVTSAVAVFGLARVFVAVDILSLLTKK
jgi:capsular polysaccharide biosynthesis protein